MRDASPLPAAVAVARLTTDAANARRISDLLTESFDADTVAVAAWEEPGGRWPITLYFGESPDEASVRALVALATTPELASTLTFDRLAPTDWVRKSLEGLKPVEAGRFVVHGAHDRARIAPNRIGIEIEAGLAFGTGHHGTTRGCLIALDRLIKGDLPARGVLDVGTGTGVLAIAAAKALHRPVLASDIDRRAVPTARENARVNRAGSRIEVIRAAGLAGRKFRERGPFAIVLANILLAPLKQLARPMARLTKPGGVVIISGLLRAQELPALGAFLPHGFALMRRVPLEGWVTLVLERRTRRRPRLPGKRT
ncbi:MAG: 50S ribosomal protein L11 methyltransferase [Pseudolabrys sp.]